MKHEFPFPEIEGYLSAQDRETLRDLARTCSKIPGAFMEIGSYKGLSAACINEGMAKDALLYCFDFFEHEKLVEFLINIAHAKYPWNIGHVQGNFRDHLAKAKEELPVIAFCFVDHSHTLDDTIAAYEWIWPRLAIGGMLLVHDYTHKDYQEPRQFLDSLKHKRVCENSILAFVKE